MKFLIFAKLILLCAALAFVVWTMRAVDESSIHQFFAALGIEAGADAPTLQVGSPIPVGAAEKYSRLNLCRTRVLSLIWPDGRKIEEAVSGLKMKWMAHDPEAREIGYLEMEKWLSLHCQIAVEDLPSQAPTATDFGVYLTLKYIDGETLAIQVASDGSFKIQDRVFRSEDLRGAMAELMQIAQFQQGSKPNAAAPKAP